MKSLTNVAGFGRRTLHLSLSLSVVCCWCHWESRPQEGGGIAQAWAMWPEGASAPNGTVMCRGHGVPEMVTPAMRTTAVFLRCFKLDKYAMFSFAMTSGLASDSDKLKIIITLWRTQTFGDMGPHKNFIFLIKLSYCRCRTMSNSCHLSTLSNGA